MTDFYNIDNIDENKKEQTAQKVDVSSNGLPDGLEGYEVVEFEDQSTQQVNIQKELEDSYDADGLEELKPLGGDIPTHESVIEDVKKEFAETSEKFSKKKAEHDEKKARRVIATADLILNRVKKPVEIPVRISEYNSEIGEIEEVDLIFKAKRLTEKQSTSLVNWELQDMKMKDMTPFEREESLAYKRRLLSQIIIEPQFTEDQWFDEVDVALVLSLFARAQHLLMSTEDTELYSDFLGAN